MLQVVGEKEKENKTVNVRTRDNVKHGETTLAHVIEVLRKERAERSLESTFGHTGVQPAAQPAANGAPGNGLAEQPAA